MGWGTLDQIEIDVLGRRSTSVTPYFSWFFGLNEDTLGVRHDVLVEDQEAHGYVDEVVRAGKTLPTSP